MTKIRPLFHLLTNRSYATQAAFKTQPYKLHRLDKGPSAEATLTKEEALLCYERMTTIRKLEATANTLYKSKKILGFCHLYSGQEAVGVGVYSMLRPQDTIITSYRCHAWAYMCFNSVDSVLAELVGVQSGAERGKGGSMHMYGKEFFGGQGIVGGQVPLGVGVALAHKYRKTDAVSVTLYGDGASNQGQVYEAYNIAKLFELPCLLICENNQYSMGTSVARSTADPDIYKKGNIIPGIKVDGMDILTVREAVRFAIDHITSGKGPIILEVNTYRYFGHSLSDPGTSYRTREEIQEVRTKKDPIKTFKAKIIEAKLATEDELKKIDAKAKSAIEEAEKKATGDKPVKLEELTYDIYANDAVIKEVRGVSPYQTWKHKASGKAFNPK